MKSQAAKFLVGAIVISSSLLLAQNCGGLQASTYLGAKEQMVSASFFASNVISRDGKCFETNPTGAETEVACPTPIPENPQPTATATQPSNPPLSNAPSNPPAQNPSAPAPVPVELFCSVQGVQKIGATLKTASSNLRYVFKASSGQEICNFEVAGAREQIINTKKIQFENLAAKCPRLIPGQYTVELRSPNGVGKSLLMTIDLSEVNGLASGQLPTLMGWIGNPYNASVSASESGQMALTSVSTPPCQGIVLPVGGGSVCTTLYGTTAAKIMFDTGSSSDPRCDRATSPLIIQLGDSPSPIRLTAPLDGVRFDIMGINANHKPLQISWLAEDSVQNNYFLVLPDAGAVHGIDQLFGDNTVGPDGKTAANGYEALRKWDGRLANGRFNLQMRDGFIRSNDPVFSRLRLWLDENRDGVAQTSELSTLESRGIVSIDLNFDPHYAEVDVYGNEIKMKSAVETSDGKLHRIFDIWFRALDL